jgi:hypothetical protein
MVLPATSSHLQQLRDELVHEPRDFVAGGDEDVGGAHPLEVLRKLVLVLICRQGRRERETAEAT